MACAFWVLVTSVEKILPGPFAGHEKMHHVD